MGKNVYLLYISFRKVMLYRKIRSYIDEDLKANGEKILLIEGARQIGKSYIIEEN